MRALLAAKADVHFKSICGCVALTVAAEAGNHRVVEMLIRAKADFAVQVRDDAF